MSTTGPGRTPWQTVRHLAVRAAEQVRLHDRHAVVLTEPAQRLLHDPGVDHLLVEGPDGRLVSTGGVGQLALPRPHRRAAHLVHHDVAGDG